MKSKILAGLICSLFICSSAGEVVTDSTSLASENVSSEPAEAGSALPLNTDSTVENAHSELSHSTQDSVPKNGKDVSGEPGAEEEAIKESADETLVENLEARKKALQDTLKALEEQIEQLKRQKVSERVVDAVEAVELIIKDDSPFSEKLTKSRAQGYGGAVAISPMLLMMKMKPVYELVHTDAMLKRYTFSDLDEGYSPLVMMGAMPYGGLGRGNRVGFGGWSGKMSIASDADSATDSVAVLSVKLNFGGVLYEKAIVKDAFNIVVGGMLGGGNIEVSREVQDASAFRLVWKESDEESETATASFVGLELHGGVIYSLLPWMHFGADVNSFLLMGANGFNNSRVSGFASVNPGFRIRIVLGNLG